MKDNESMQGRISEGDATQMLGWVDSFFKAGNHQPSVIDPAETRRMLMEQYGELKRRSDGCKCKDHREGLRAFESDFGITPDDYNAFENEMMDEAARRARNRNGGER